MRQLKKIGHLRLLNGEWHEYYASVIRHKHSGIRTFRIVDHWNKVRGIHDALVASRFSSIVADFVYQ